MTDPEKASLLLKRASRVLTWPESLLCASIRDGISVTADDRHRFSMLCLDHAAYLKP